MQLLQTLENLSGAFLGHFLIKLSTPCVQQIIERILHELLQNEESFCSLIRCCVICVIIFDNIFMPHDYFRQAFYSLLELLSQNHVTQFYFHQLGTHPASCFSVQTFIDLNQACFPNAIGDLEVQLSLIRLVLLFYLLEFKHLLGYLTFNILRWIFCALFLLVWGIII